MQYNISFTTPFNNRIGYNISNQKQLIVSKHNFTPEDLVQFLYNETSPKKSEAIKAALETDFNLKEMFNEIASAQIKLEELKLSPRNETINKILQHAEKGISQLHHH